MKKSDERTEQKTADQHNESKERQKKENTERAQKAPGGANTEGGAVNTTPDAHTKGMGSNQ